MISAKFDHIVVTVANLDRAVADFSDLGFEVTRGGAHGQTEMAMIVFADGTYIELISLRASMLRRLLKLAGRIGVLHRLLARKPDVYRRLMSWFGRAPGPVDWCIRVADLDGTVAHWKNAGLSCLESGTFHRTRPDGLIARWRLGSSVDVDLPFAIEDSTDVRIRVPDDPTPSHLNGALGIRCLHIVRDDPKAVQNVFADAFPAAPIDDQSGLQFGPTCVKIRKKSGAEAPFQLVLNCSGPERQLIAANMPFQFCQA